MGCSDELDYFAARAMAGLLAHRDTSNPEGLAEKSYRIAEAMIAERERRRRKAE